MPLIQLVKIILPGLLPLLVYVVASEVWGDFVGLVVGVSLGVVEFFFLWVVRKKIDGFVAVDTALLVALGAISLGLDDHVFFRLKPVFTEVLLVALLAYSSWGQSNLLLGMAFRGEVGQRMKAALEAKPDALVLMRRRMRWLTVLFGAHTLLALASALWMDEAAWAFITTILPFILVGLVFLGLTINQKLIK